VYLPRPSGRRLAPLLRQVGPGLVVAATGVGAGDLIAAGKAGATFGLTILWAVVAGAGLKLVLAEGVARWQLATGTTLLEGWFRHLGAVTRAYFFAYLAVWSLVVGAALMSACGLAAHALVPALSVRAWAALHGLAAFALVWFEGYAAMEKLMKVAVGAMFVTIVGSAVLAPPPLAPALGGLLVPRIPAGGAVLTAGVIGGVGGSLTLLSYSYWIREKGWRGRERLALVRLDLVVAYALTALFGLALVALGATVLLPRGVAVTGSGGALQLAAMLGARLGRPGELLFLVGFWAAVTTSVIGVWQGIPYLFADACRLAGVSASTDRLARTPAYRAHAAYLTFPPMLLLLLDRPVWMVVAYAALGSLFMPFLAATLLRLNTRRAHVGELVNRPMTNLALLACLALFAYLAIAELAGVGG